jgi:hypothetical protein
MTTLDRLTRPASSSLDDYNDQQKRRAMQSLSSNSLLSATPFYFGDFVKSCGGSSSSSFSNNGADEVGSSGCFGIRMGGISGGDGRATTRSIPPTGEKDDDPTVLIAKAMNHLSLQEREEAYEDLHGVSAQVHETPELIAKTLHEMEHCLQGIHHKHAYVLAEAFRDDYVQDPTLRLLFLRADRFDAEKSAKRLVDFLDWKLKLFGEEKLCQWHIGLDDLDEDAQFLVKSGVDQILPSRDTRGRAVFVILGNFTIRCYLSTHSTLQFVFYMYQCLAEDETNQKKGIVAIAYTLGNEEGTVKSGIKDSVWESTKLAACMPIRIEATHFCLPKSRVHFTLNLVARSAGLLTRARIRVHVGSHLECVYALLSFGVPSNLLPFTTDCELKTNHHKKWVQRRIVKEQELLRCSSGSNSDVFSGIELPDRNDVLLGKGKPLQNHPGNQRLLELSRAFLDEYTEANNKGGKTVVARKVVQEILYPSHGWNSVARFLQRREDKLESGWWEEVTDEQVLIAKAANTFRGIRKRGGERY